MSEVSYNWYIGMDGYPTNVNFIDVPEKPMSAPFPSALWRVENDKIINKLLIEIPEKPMTKPYPKALWRIENGRLIHELLPTITSGFSNTINLGKICINSSIKLSFPKKCRLNFLYRI